MEKRMKEYKGHKMGQVKDFKELLNRAADRYGDKVAFEYKKDSSSKTPEYRKHTFKEYKEEAENLGTALMDLGLKGKRIALIAPNRYEWCTSYISVVAGGMVIVPLDKALPDVEIKSLIQRSKADCVIFDPKYLAVFNEIRKEGRVSFEYLYMYGSNRGIGGIELSRFNTKREKTKRKRKSRI